MDFTEHQKAILLAALNHYFIDMSDDLGYYPCPWYFEHDRSDGKPNLSFPTKDQVRELLDTIKDGQ